MVLRVKLEIVPFGDETKIREIGRLDIFNKGQIGHAHKYGVIDLGEEPGLFSDEVIHYRPDGAWELVKSAIEDLEIKGP